MSTTFQPRIGPKDKRVLVLTDMKKNVPAESNDVATGRQLAASDFFEPLTMNSLTTPGFGGRVFFPTGAGKGFYILQVKPAKTQ